MIQPGIRLSRNRLSRNRLSRNRLSRNRLSRRGVLQGAGALALASCVHPGGESGGGRLYYLGAAKLFALDLPGGAPRVLVDQTPRDGGRPTGVNDGIAIDRARGHIYWSNMGRSSQRDGYIQRCGLDGSNVTMIVPPGGAFTPKQIKLAGGRIYWSDREGMAVMRCRLDGSQIETLVRTGDPDANKGEEDRWCVGVAVDDARGQLYWTQKGGDNAGKGVIRRAGIDLTKNAGPDNRNDIETLFSNLPEPIDMELDLASRRIYWSDRGDNTLARAPMDGAGRGPGDREVLARGLKEAIGIAIDPSRRRMAATSLGGEVWLGGIDGGGGRLIAEGQGMLTGIAWGP